jgi:hypothetical protein
MVYRTCLIRGVRTCLRVQSVWEYDRLMLDFKDGEVVDFTAGEICHVTGAPTTWQDFCPTVSTLPYLYPPEGFNERRSVLDVDATVTLLDIYAICYRHVRTRLNELVCDCNFSRSPGNRQILQQ